MCIMEYILSQLTTEHTSMNVCDFTRFLELKYDIDRNTQYGDIIIDSITHDKDKLINIFNEINNIDRKNGLLTTRGYDGITDIAVLSKWWIIDLLHKIGSDDYLKYTIQEKDIMTVFKTIAYGVINDCFKLDECPIFDLFDNITDEISRRTRLSKWCITHIIQNTQYTVVYAKTSLCCLIFYYYLKYMHRVDKFDIYDMVVSITHSLQIQYVHSEYLNRLFKNICVFKHCPENDPLCRILNENYFYPIEQYKPAGGLITLLFEYFEERDDPSFIKYIINIKYKFLLNSMLTATYMSIHTYRIISNNYTKRIENGYSNYMVRTHRNMMMLYTPL